VIRPFGEAAFLIELDGPEGAQAAAAALSDPPIPGVLEIVPALRSVLVEVDPERAAADIQDELEARAAARRRRPPQGRRRTIPVVYGGDHGPDLAEVAALCGLSAADLIERHTAIELRVLFAGFAPGFAYLGILPPDLRVPRLATPRTRTPAGSVAVADMLSGIYPSELPGGWRVIGRTPLAMFDPRRQPPAYLVAGDAVRFQAIPASAWDDHVGEAGDWE
jgi:KipI family sensor histidine kinase inhibitor